MSGRNNEICNVYCRDWAQSFIFQAESGYTEGWVGIGLDWMCKPLLVLS
ncbi:OprD family outer membrane porin [Acinetobacter pullicarnis]